MGFKLLHRPRISAFIILALDMVMLILCVILTYLEGYIGTIYHTDENLKITVESPFWYFGIVAAAVLVIQAGFTAIMIIANFNSGQRGSLWQGNVAAALIMALSAGVAIAAAGLVVHDFDEMYSYAYTDQTKKVVLLERKRAVLGESTLTIFKVDGDKTFEAAVVPLREVSGNSDRYKLEWVLEDELCISFEDGYNYRSVNILIE